MAENWTVAIIYYDMDISTTFDHIHARSKQNRWMRFFTVFCRISLAMGFLPSGFVKIMGERFTDLSNNHPMGHYLEALHHTGYYYTFIGILQVSAALLLLIPRTATIGAILYFPIILNICILSLAVRFDGSLLSSPLMVLANLYLLCWDYDKLKALIFPKRILATTDISNKPTAISNRFPIRFFACVLVMVLAVGFTLTNIFEIMPRNTLDACRTQIKKSKHPNEVAEFCDCIHVKGQSLDQALTNYKLKTRKK